MRLEPGRRCNFARLVQQKRMHLQVGKFFGLEDADYPAFAIHDQANDGKYISKNVKAGSVKKYVKDFLVRRAMGVRLRRLFMTLRP